jgi:hypothetical protein
MRIIINHEPSDCVYIYIYREYFVHGRKDESAVNYKLKEKKNQIGSAY